MSILFPIQDHPTPEVSIAANFIGTTVLTADLSVQNGLRASIVGDTTITANLSIKRALAANFVGNTLISAFLRINAEANVFMAANFVGDTELTVNFTPRIGGGANFVGSTVITATLSVQSSDEASLTILVDILDANLLTAQAANIHRYAARFLVDGVEKSIRRATLEAASNTLGTELRVTLAEPDASLVTFTSSITFQIGIWTGSAFTYLTLISGGKLSSRENAIKNEGGRPFDEVTLSIVDIVADRWNRAPRVPIHIYDPLRVSAPDQSALASQRIQVYHGGYINPITIAIDNLSLRTVLAEAYISGTGFSSIISNIPNFPVLEADFTLDGGYDGGVRSLLAPFAPLLFERNNVLFIIDPDAPLPSGFSPRTFAESSIQNLTPQIPQHEPVNAILVQVQDGTGGEYYTERIDQDPPAGAGVFGTPGYTETTTQKRIREWRNFAAPDVIVREENVSEKTTVVDYQFNPIEVTDLIQTFDILNRKTGHSRRTSKLLPDINNDGVLTFMSDVTRQEQQITYRPDPLDPSQDVQDTVATVESGLILVDDGNQYLGKPFKIPITDAHVTAYLNPDSGGDQHTEQGDIKTTTESLRMRGSQIDTEVRVVNHLANVATQTTITTRPGAVTINRKRQQSHKTLLLTIDGTGSQGRRAPTLNAGALPVNIAVELGFRKLRQLNSPPLEIALNPAYIDITVKRGTILASQGRGGAALGNFIVLGYSIDFEEYKAGEGVLGRMALKLRQLTA